MRPYINVRHAYVRRPLVVSKIFYYNLICKPSKMVFEHFSKPDTRNPVFCPVVRFSKKYIFETYTLQGILGCKNFPGQKVSGFRFFPKSPPYGNIILSLLSGDILSCFLPSFQNQTPGIRDAAKIVN